MDYDQVHWGVTGCSAPFCSEPAELLWESDPMCIPCADLLLERISTIGEFPAAREWLPDLFREDDVWRGV